MHMTLACIWGRMLLHILTRLHTMCFSGLWGVLEGDSDSHVTGFHQTLTLLISLRHSGEVFQTLLEDGICWICTNVMLSRTETEFQGTAAAAEKFTKVIASTQSFPVIFALHMITLTSRSWSRTQCLPQCWCFVWCCVSSLFQTVCGDNLYESEYIVTSFTRHKLYLRS